MYNVIIQVPGEAANRRVIGLGFQDQEHYFAYLERYEREHQIKLVTLARGVPDGVCLDTEIKVNEFLARPENSRYIPRQESAVDKGLPATVNS